MHLKYIVLAVLLVFGAVHATGQKNLYDFSARTISGERFDFSTLKGKKVLIVNTATECSLSYQFKKLQKLYEEYGGDDFEIVAFPCNDFGSQEPGTNEQVKEYCTKKYQVSFLLMEKISIKGENMHPIYKWLTSKEENGVLNARVNWNFHKFLIDKNGQVVESVSSITSPGNRKIVAWLNQTETP
ncbi:glutathione peroxidase [Mariniphaga anaerophila]|uniref:Glutathione peroxidase n=1 Tax=Mariniphaga anaerophila TaxID=1484053 RepID=A0A1M4SHB4_9BACT|nr:glutathione peroxidase [Mariniphaga anaerophila]SHE31542.1 glutathione peroxidase [Mariniphaga anaerophila]